MNDKERHQQALLAQAQDSSEVLGVDFRLNEASNTEITVIEFG